MRYFALFTLAAFKRLSPPRQRLRAALLAVVWLLSPATTHPADLNAQMQGLFNDLGTLGNVTSPGAFRGQAMNLYTGGNLMMRTPGKNYPLANAQLPSLKAGCGGIDLFGGSFSFINKQQFVSMLQNIGANAMGYAFKLALQSISPDIDKLLTELQDQINKINALNINSCEAAQSLVNGAVGAMDNASQTGCANISQYLGTVSDRVDARVACASNAATVLKNAANSADPSVKNAAFVQGNVLWNALNQVGGGISQAEKELMMSVVGTVIVSPPADDGTGSTTQYLEPTIKGIRDLLLGTSESATPNQVNVSVYVCDEPQNCLNPVVNTLSVQPFTTLVAAKLENMSQNIVNHTAQSAADIGFINNTTEPVYKMLAIANAVPGSQIAETLIQQYQGIIAIDYAETFLNQAIRKSFSALSQSLKRNEMEKDAIELLRKNAREAQNQILQEKNIAYGKLRSVSAMTQDLQTLERQLWSAMPPAIKGMMNAGGG